MAMCLFPKSDAACLIFAPVAYRQRERFRILSQVGFKLVDTGREQVGVLFQWQPVLARCRE
jgi:hypothetical protein